MTKQRQKITLTMTTTDILVLMSEGNPGGLTVLCEMMKKDPMNMFVILHLDDMNMRGSQIWVGYKDYCKEDLNKFIECCKKRDKDMVNLVNKECPENIAVTSGASF